MRADRETLEAQVERALRRGELGQALALLRTLLAAFPDDAAIAARIQDLSDSLQPAELLHPKANAAPPPPPPPSDDPAHEGERLAALSDFAGAAAAYRAAVAADPGNELFRERLEELYQLALAAPPRPARSERPALLAAPRAAVRSASPDPEGVLTSLLDRISARRRA